MDNNSLLQKAAQQALSESLGHEESCVYYSYLIKNQEKLKKEYSYSKRYRMLKNLFNLGAVAKLKTEDRDIFSYLLLPPSFLYFSKNVEEKIIKYLEEIYLKNYSDILTLSFSQLVLRDERSLIIFLLKYFMQDSAHLSIEKINYKKLGLNSSKIQTKSSNKEKKMGTIDNSFAFEFSRVRNKEAYDYVGYLSNKKGSSQPDYVFLVEKELKRHL